MKIRFVMSASYFSALIVSSSFKNENVYNIVLPRKQLSYHTIDELSEDSYKIYNRLDTVFISIYEVSECGTHPYFMDKYVIKHVEAIALR